MGVCTDQSRNQQRGACWPVVLPVSGKDGVTLKMDESHLEMAEALEASQRNWAIAQSSHRAIPSIDLTPEQYRQFECKDCGEDLEDFRLKKGCLRCTHCQTKRERLSTKGLY